MSPESIVKLMMKNDLFSQWMGIQVIEIKLGKCILETTVREEMLNGFDIAHGGISYSLADSCLAFAANSYGLLALSIETSIKHLKKVTIGDSLRASSKLINKTENHQEYQVLVTNQFDEIVADFMGKVHLSNKKWSDDLLEK
ncbi:MAG: hotdog fold thioesterase [Flavobacteriales bacterium]|nr:hotdog fold thioesterase [Flavobacteriales bacterium]